MGRTTILPTSPALIVARHSNQPEAVFTGYRIEARNYDLAATLSSGQAFRWRWTGQHWEGVIGDHWVRLASDPQGIVAETAVPNRDWTWLTDYLQACVNLEEIVATFPDDAPLQGAAAACRGLRLLRQEPWECLASFILSSTKQIVQIQQVIALLCSRYGSAVTVPAGHAPDFAFPRPEQLAGCSESELRDCRMGFRAPYLLTTARLIAAGRFDLNLPYQLPLEAARNHLMALPGVGRKIADCVLLFAYGRNEAFPVDVWVMRAICELYFPRRRISRSKLLAFTESHFGPFAGYAQQYLFHYMRVRRKSAT
jgi:N-glycosylase/DNA lyase